MSDVYQVVDGGHVEDDLDLAADLLNRAANLINYMSNDDRAVVAWRTDLRRLAGQPEVAR